MLALKHFLRAIEGGEIAERAIGAVELGGEAELITVAHVDAGHERVGRQRHVVLAIVAIACLVVVGEECVGTL